MITVYILTSITAPRKQKKAKPEIQVNDEHIKGSHFHFITQRNNYKHFRKTRNYYCIY